MQFDVMGVSTRSTQCSAVRSRKVTFPVVLCVFIVVLAEELAKGDGSFQASLRCMLLDGSLHEVAGLLSKSLFGEPLVTLAPGLTSLLTLPLQHLHHLFHPPSLSPLLSPSVIFPHTFFSSSSTSSFSTLPFPPPPLSPSAFSSFSPLFSLHLIFLLPFCSFSLHLL